MLFACFNHRFFKSYYRKCIIMKEKRRSRRGNRKPKIAIYDVPKIVGRKLSASLREAGCSVLHEGPLSPETARNDADIWIAKWTFLFKRDFLMDFHPSRGIVTLSVGTDHIDKGAIAELGIALESCPSFSSTSVAEHAMTLAMRSLYPEPILPPLEAGQIIFTRFSDDYAEQAVAHMLMRARQINESVERAQNYEYYREDRPQYRHDEPWANTELSNTKVGIVGSDRQATTLARILSSGFNCKLFLYDTAGDFDLYKPERLTLPELLEVCDYVFLCSDRYGLQKPSADDEMINPKQGPRMRTLRVDSVDELPLSDTRFSGSHVAVLGTGNIGSIIARMARPGFGCEIAAFSRTPKKELENWGVRYKDTVEAALSRARFIFIALPLNYGTRELLDWEQLFRIAPNRPRVLVNVTRDQIIESESLYDMLSLRGIHSYATDVLPNDALLWKRRDLGERHAEPDELTRKFVQHPNVIATPHEGDCSAPSLERMWREALNNVMKIMVIGDVSQQRWAGIPTGPFPYR